MFACSLHVFQEPPTVEVGLYFTVLAFLHVHIVRCVKKCEKLVGSYYAVCWVFVQLDVMYIHTCIHTCILDLGSFVLDLMCMLMLSL